jgi:hypothetical protein
MEGKDSSSEKTLRREKKELKEGSSPASKARPGPSPTASKRLENIETIRSGTKLQSVSSPKPSKEEMVVSVATLHDVTQVMTAANITEDDLWEGKTDLFPIILHYGTELIAAAMANENFCILEIKLPDLPEFQGIDHKLYKCDPFWTVHHTVSMVCKRFGIADSRSFSLATSAGFSLQDSEPLATFGLGSLLPRWQLSLQQRAGTMVTRMDTIKAYQAVTSRPSARSVLAGSESPRSAKKKTSHKKSASITAEERYPVLLLLDTTVFKYKSQRVHVRAASTIQDLIDAITRAHSISATAPLVISTLSGTLLDKSGVLSEFGLGKRFQRWQLRLTQPDGSSKVPLKSSYKYAWTQIDEANMQPGEAKKIILELDKKVERVRRQAVKDSQSSSSSSVALKTMTKLEAELAKTKDAKQIAEKAAAEATLKLEAQLKAHLAAKAEFETTIARLQAERDEHKAKNRELEKQRTSDKNFFETQVQAHQKSLTDTLHRISNTSHKSRKSAATAFDSKASSGDLSASSPRSSKSKGEKAASEKASSSTSSATEAAKDEANAALLAAQAELQVAQADLELLKKEMAHQKEQYEAKVEAMRSEDEQSRTEIQKLRTQMAELEAANVLAKTDVENLAGKVRTLIASLDQEKTSRREAVEKIVELEHQRAMDEEARSEALIERMESEMDAKYAELLATNRELYAGIDEMKTQLIETGRERDELRKQIDEMSGDIASESIEAKETTKSPPPPAPPAPAPSAPPAPPKAPSLPSTGTDGKKTVSRRSKSKVQREDSVFLGLALATRIEQGRSKLRAVPVGPQKKTYSSDLEAALHRRFLAMSSEEDLEELSDGEDSDEENPFDLDDSISSSGSASRTLFDLKL